MSSVGRPSRLPVRPLFASCRYCRADAEAREAGRGPVSEGLPSWIWLRRNRSCSVLSAENSGRGPVRELSER